MPPVCSIGSSKGVRGGEWYMAEGGRDSLI